MRCERVVVLASILALLDESECKTRNTEKIENFQFLVHMDPNGLNSVGSDGKA